MGVTGFLALGLLGALVLAAALAGLAFRKKRRLLGGLILAGWLLLAAGAWLGLGALVARM